MDFKTNHVVLRCHRAVQLYFKSLEEGSKPGKALKSGRIPETEDRFEAFQHGRFTRSIRFT